MYIHICTNMRVSLVGKQVARESGGSCSSLGVLVRVAVRCSALLWCAAVRCCSVLQCVPGCCSVLQCVAVCCSVLQCLELVDMQIQESAYICYIFV